jgi:hypothetical protein
MADDNVINKQNVVEGKEGGDGDGNNGMVGLVNVRVGWWILRARLP